MDWSGPGSKGKKQNDGGRQKKIDVDDAWDDDEMGERLSKNF